MLKQTDRLVTGLAGPMSVTKRARGRVGSTAAGAAPSRQRDSARWLTASITPDLVAHEVTAHLIRTYAYAHSAKRLRPRSIRGNLNALRALNAIADAAPINSKLAGYRAACV